MKLISIRPVNAKTVRDLALEHPPAARVFERYGIDYCCGGGVLIEEACLRANANMADVLRDLEAERTRTYFSDFDPRAASLSGLIGHIVERHHAFTRAELDALDPLAAKVLKVHGPRRPELAEVRRRFEQLRDDLIPHMMKEELVLFPYIRNLDEALAAGARPPDPHFGTVRNPIRMMELEHETTGGLLAELRRLTDNYTPPERACTSYRILYDRLKRLEADVHQHVHLENNALFPRAKEAEDAVFGVVL